MHVIYRLLGRRSIVAIRVVHTGRPVRRGVRQLVCHQVAEQYRTGLNVLPGDRLVIHRDVVRIYALSRGSTAARTSNCRAIGMVLQVLAGPLVVCGRVVLVQD